MVRSAIPIEAVLTPDELRKRIKTSALAFRGYEERNVGRSFELLAHPVYGPIVSATLKRASALCSEVRGTPVDLEWRVLGHATSSLATFVEDVASIVAMEVAQFQLLEQVFDIPVHDARLSFGHSIGELASLLLGGVYEMDQLLPVPLGLAQDCADLTANTTIGLLSVTGQPLSIEQVRRLCIRISSRGHGLIGPSTYLSPYKVILLGQGDTLDLLEREMPDHLQAGATLKRRPNRFPPLHTPLVWERNVPNRTALALYHIAGGERKPTPPVVSCMTGVANYDELNSRGILADWTDHPQRLWEVMKHTLASGVELVIHVGPEPRLFPAGFDRLSEKIRRQMRKRHLDRLGNSLFPSISRNQWLNRSLPGRAALLRAPFLDHLVLEDWLLAQDIS
ncbi:MAG: ACP S-malonyltransferase [Isosphaeraceae bacterium]